MQEHSWQPPLAVTYRGFVYPWQLDRHGRMYVQTQVARFDEAAWHLMALLGLGPRRLSEERRTFVTLEQRISYAQNVGTAAVLHIDSELVEIGASTLRHRHTLRDSETHRTLSTMQRLSVLTALDHRGPSDLPAALTRRAQVLFPAVAVHSGKHEIELAA